MEVFDEKNGQSICMYKDRTLAAVIVFENNLGETLLLQRYPHDRTCTGK
jgi:hypothetical protein